MAVAGYTELVYVKATADAAVSGDKVDGIQDFSFSRTVEMEETTDTKDGTGYKTRITKLRDTSVDMSGQYAAADTVQILLRAAYESGATLYVTVHTDPGAAGGSKGWRIPALVESYDAKVTVGGVGEFSCKMSGNGAPVAV